MRRMHGSGTAVTKKFNCTLCNGRPWVHGLDSKEVMYEDGPSTGM